MRHRFIRIHCARPSSAIGSTRTTAGTIEADAQIRGRLMRLHPETPI
jgi:hypothetical protein